MKYQELKLYFHFYGTLMEDEVTTKQFSEPLGRKSNDNSKNFENLLIQFKRLAISSGTVAFQDQYFETSEAQNPA